MNTIFKMGRASPSAKLLLATAILAAAPARGAQETPSPVPAPAPAPAPLTLPAPVVEPIALSSEQVTRLGALLGPDAFAQGLTSDQPDPASAPDASAILAQALDHGRAVHGGRLAADDFQSDWGLRPAGYDPRPALADAVKRDRLDAWLASLPPPYAGYEGLRHGLDVYRGLAAAGGWQSVAAGPDLKAGSTGARVVALRARLAMEDREVAAAGDAFDAALTQAVRRAQRRYGLNPSGTVSTQTLAALNVPAPDRVNQIMANMERWRWLPENLPRNRIQVNIAAAILTVFQGDRPIASMRAVTGRPGDETPMLSSVIHSIVINPPWNVPTSIATRELWPKEKKNPGYLKRAGFRVIDGTRLQQAAGDQSALGRYKFDFDNPYAVYLHDTPSRAKFASFSRLASHGCVRLEKPGELAELLLADDPAWTPETIAATVADGKTVRARLTTPVQVYLLYWTAFASADGSVNFRADPYNWDRMLADKVKARSALQSQLLAEGPVQ